MSTGKYIFSGLVKYEVQYRDTCPHGSVKWSKSTFCTGYFVLVSFPRKIDCCSIQITIKARDGAFKGPGVKHKGHQYAVAPLVETNRDPSDLEVRRTMKYYYFPISNQASDFNFLTM